MSNALINTEHDMLAGIEKIRDLTVYHFPIIFEPKGIQVCSDSIGE